MKRTLTLFAYVVICCAMAVSCKNAKTAEPTPEEIQAQKVALADSVLAQIDALAEQLYDATSKSFRICDFELTDEEKMVKPDFLLDPLIAATLVTKYQKINALAIYSIELGVRQIYDMPCDDVKEVIVKLAADINHPFDLDVELGDVPVSEKVRNFYEKWKERGDIAYFWQLQNAMLIEIGYLVANNPALFFNNIKDEQWQGFTNRVIIKDRALVKMAKYDSEMAVLSDFMQQFGVMASDEEIKAVCSSCEAASKFVTANKDKYIARRNALLQ